jgi:formamidopyrimidine-DNA glycosylase
MPELPEVETVANGVNQRVRGETIRSVWFSSKREPFKTPSSEMAELLPGRRIDRVYRVGKHIVVDLLPGGRAAKRTVDLQWIVHLGMTGRLLVSAAAIPLPPHTHAVATLGSGRELRFVDPRRFGRLALHKPTADENSSEGSGRKAQGRFRGPGTEPLSITGSDFIELFRGRKQAIKSALLNQKLLQGVGNIYADESLFRAGIRPRRMAGRLTRAELLSLHSAVQEVLKEAISLGGSSVSDYVDANGEKGFFQLRHRVYLRTGEPCLTCGAPIRRIVLGGRGTHYCTRCQK